MKKIVITGNIGAGKSTIMNIFTKYNIPIFNADSAVDDIYKNSNKLKQELKKINNCFVIDNTTSKSAIINYLQKKPDFIETLENLIYPLLAIKRQEFIDIHHNNKEKSVLFEIPLLFEKNLQDAYDIIILVYAPYEIRLERALRRTGMTKEKFDFMNKRQIDYTKLLNKATIAIDTTVPLKECEDMIKEKFFNTINAD